MIKKVLILPDVHLTEDIPKPYSVVRKFINDQKKFDEVILLGDFMDVAALSHWDLDKKRLIEGKRFDKECKLANQELNFLQKHSKKITYLEGNHENFVERYLDKNPELEGMLEIPKKLHLKERGIKWVKMNDLYKVGHCYFTHGMYSNKYHATKHLMTLGCNIVYGHVHRTQMDMVNMKMQEPVYAVGLGCLCGHKPHFMKNRHANWINGFAVMYYNTKTKDFNLYPINIIKDKFIFEGKEYK